MSLLNPNRQFLKKQVDEPGTVQFQHGRRRRFFGKEGLMEKKLPTAYNQPDGTLHPRVFNRHHQKPSEMTVRLTPNLNPNFSKIPNPKYKLTHIHLMSVVSVRREIDDTPGNYISAMAASFSSTSVYNYTHVVTEKSSNCQFQLGSLIEAMTVAYNNQAALRADNCTRLLVLVDEDMEWIVRVLCRFNEFMDRTAEDEARLHEYVRYPERIKQLLECIEAFEVLTGIRVQFWPTKKYELSFAHIFAEQAIEYYLDNYDHEYYGVFDADDYMDDMDSYSDEDELESVPESDEQAILEEAAPIVVQDELPHLPADIQQSIEEIEEMFVEDKLNSQPELKLAGFNMVNMVVEDSQADEKAELLMIDAKPNDEVNRARVDEMTRLAEARAERLAQEKAEEEQRKMEALAQEQALMKQIADEIESKKREINMLQLQHESILRRMGFNVMPKAQPEPKQGTMLPPKTESPAGLRMRAPRLELSNIPTLTFGDLQFIAVVGVKDNPILVEVDVTNVSPT